MNSPNASKCILWTALLLLYGCSSVPVEQTDRYETINRAVFEFNEVVDRAATKPAAKAYDAVAPLPVKASVGNLFANAGDLLNGVNNGLQGKPGEAASDWTRLLINSTIGILGLFDVASEMGFEKHDEDFGQTLAKWGVGEGDYLVLPIVGPRTTRDVAGLVVEVLVDPLQEIQPVAARNGAYVLRLVDQRRTLLPLDTVLEEAIDRYISVRNAYLQHRHHLIRDGNAVKTDGQ